MWNHGTQGDPEEALNKDDAALENILQAKAEVIPALPEEDSDSYLQRLLQTISQQRFDTLRGSPNFNPELENYERKHFDQKPEKQ